MPIDRAGSRHQVQHEAVTVLMDALADAQREIRPANWAQSRLAVNDIKRSLEVARNAAIELLGYTDKP
jgi:hypothetical protein